MDNHVNFKLGDIVCSKKEFSTPFGDEHYSPFETYPMKVVEVYEDKDAENRIGELGGSHEYRLEPMIFNEVEGMHTIRRLQYTLCFWSERKCEVCEAVGNYFIKLGEVKESR